MRLKLVAVAVAALAPVVAMLGYNEYAMRQQRGDEVRVEAAQAARQASSEVERIVEGLRSLLIAVTSMPSVRHLDVPVCNEALKSLAANVPNIKTIFILSPDGRPVCGSVAIPASTNFADRPYFRKAIETRGFVVGEHTKSRVSDSAVLPLAMPALEDGKVSVVVVSGIRLDWLQNRIVERGVAPGNTVTLADGDGTIVARVPSPDRFVGTVIPDEFQPLVHADAPGIIEVKSQDGTDRILGYRPIALPVSPLYVSAGLSTADAFAPINRTTWTSTIAIAVGALISLALSIFIGDRFLLAPISRIAEVMERWRAGDTDIRTKLTGDGELHAVGATLDSLLDELERRRFESERAEEERSLLVHELAHRVKNGFALVQAMAQRTFMRSDPERYKSFSERIASLSRTYDLILTGEGVASPLEETVAVAMRAHSSGDDRVNLTGPAVMLPPDLTLPLSLVIHELATNAIKYGSLSSEHGTVAIEWRLEGNRVFLNWREGGGPPVSAPSRKGFGSVLIERAFPGVAQARSRTAFEPDGILFELEFVLPLHAG